MIFSIGLDLPLLSLFLLLYHHCILIYIVPSFFSLVKSSCHFHWIFLYKLLIMIKFQAESLTGIADPVLAGQELLRKGVRTKWVIIKMGPKGSLLITMSSISCAPAFKV